MNYAHAKDLDIDKRYIIQIARQFVHPENGIGKGYTYKPTVIKDWFNMLNEKNTVGWVNAGIEEELGEILAKLNIGEILPNTNPDLTIYKYSFFTQTILSKLRPQNENGHCEEITHRIIMNYNSFIKLIKAVENDILPYEREHYMEDFMKWNKKIVPRIFWVHFVIPESTAIILKKNNIGEVITKYGSSNFFKLRFIIFSF